MILVGKKSRHTVQQNSGKCLKKDVKTRFVTKKSVSGKKKKVKKRNV